MSFEVTDLGMSDQAISQIETQLANANNADPIGDAIARQTQTVSDYTLRFVIPQERQYKLIRALVLYDLWSNPALGSLPPGVETAYKQAMQELKDIRDGKFPDLELLHPNDPSLAPQSDSARWGSNRRTDMSRGDWCE